MTDDVLVRVENVSKRFCRSLKRSLWFGLQDLGSEIGVRGHGGGRGLPQSSADVLLRQDEFWAVKDVSFELRRGDCLGIVGSNGAGKTTVLKLINGLIKPDTGTIAVKGKIGGMIALGCGFNPVLSARENIYISASVMGVSKNEIDEKFLDILNFSELHDFIDSPVQSFSSGMIVRLGFAVASSFKPDVLLLDEVLAVGDQRFRNKCFERMDVLRKHCATIFISHSEEQVSRLSNTGIFLQKGSTVFQGDIQRCLSLHRTSIPSTGTSNRSQRSLLISKSIDEESFDISHSRSDNTLNLKIDFNSYSKLAAHLRVIVFNSNSNSIAFEVNSKNSKSELQLIRGRNSITAAFDCSTLRNGDYTLGLNLTNSANEYLVSGMTGLCFRQTANNFGETDNQQRFIDLTQSCEK